MKYMLWALVPGTPKPKKIPINPLTGRVHSVTDTAAHVDIDAARAWSAVWNLPIAAVINADEPYFFIDLDAVMIDGQQTPEARGILSMFPGAFTEVSQSGQGLHIIGRSIGSKPRSRQTPHVSLYTNRRFVALTMRDSRGSMESEHDLSPFVTKYLPELPMSPTTQLISDTEILERCRQQRSAGQTFGSIATFDDLWNARDLGRFFPSTTGQSYDSSRADAALAKRLMFHSGNTEQVERLMRQSALVREKWDRPGYLVNTIHRCARNNDSAPYVPLDSQSSVFAGCTYINDIHRIITPNGSMLKPEQFRARYGGPIFALDAQGKKTTRNAWQAFTESIGSNLPKVDSTTFRPDLPASAIISKANRTYVNSYIDPKTACEPGDVSMFLDHVAKLLPVQHDRDILLAYIAAIVQYKGIKFQWCPLLQGTEGNGKSLLTSCLAEAVGLQYYHSPRADRISNNFNAWARDRIFIGVEDVYIPEDRGATIEILKPLITSSYIAVEAKGIDQIVSYVCMNFLLNSNHRDAIRKTGNDRRFAVFFSAQQTAQDIVSAGMGGDYFPRIYAWLRNGGYAHVHHYLLHYQIPEALNPATECQRAPITSSTTQALYAGLGAIEQEVLEAVEQNRIGFRAPWISSTWLDRLVGELRVKISRAKRDEMLRVLGYIPHPALRGGRATTCISIDGVCSQLYIRQDQVVTPMTGPEAVRAYEVVQQGQR
mgnify:CR=1 FL=1